MPDPLSFQAQPPCHSKRSLPVIPSAASLSFRAQPPCHSERSEGIYSKENRFSEAAFFSTISGKRFSLPFLFPSTHLHPQLPPSTLLPPPLQIHDSRGFPGFSVPFGPIAGPRASKTPIFVPHGPVTGPKGTPSPPGGSPAPASGRYPNRAGMTKPRDRHNNAAGQKPVSMTKQQGRNSRA